ncbi:TauD/TfdA dioxygenase family protein [Rhodopila sp.]|uniref:TauD/TfdA dioxygenase family protein n=1 Tax=Rhodopila sp. TaxID=2480087 RepID=UPI003D147C4F
MTTALSNPPARPIGVTPNRPIQPPDAASPNVTSPTVTSPAVTSPTVTSPSATGRGAQPLGATSFGATIPRLDLRAITDADFAAIHQAWIDHQVLVFPAQALTDADLIAFSRRFGELDHAPVQENGQRFASGMPEIYVVSNVIENGEAIGSLGAGEAVWHTDMSYLPSPPKASMLFALEIPPTGGDTWFCNMYAAFESLPPDLRQHALGLRVKHDGTYNSGGYLRQGVTPTDDPRQAPGTLHPLVCTHPESHRRMLYLGRRRMAWIDGLSLPESGAVLDEIWAHATRTEISFAHHWQVGDLVLWDNRCTMHRRDPFEATSRRVMHRTQIKGAAPPAA